MLSAQIEKKRNILQRFILDTGIDPSKSSKAISPDKIYQEGKKFLEQKEFDQAEKSFKKIADQPVSHAEAQYQLGIIYLSQDKNIEAVNYFDLAAKQNHSQAQYELGMCYLHGRGTLQNISQAIKLAEQVLKKKYDFGESLLRSCYAFKLTSSNENLFSEEIEREFISHAQEIVKRKEPVDPNILFYFGLFCEKLATKKDLTAARDLYIRAANENKGCPKADYRLGNLYEINNENTEALCSYERGALRGHVECLYELGRCYYFGLPGITPDLDKAFSYLELATSKGHREAENLIGKMYLEGKAIEKNPKKAVEFFQSAAKKGNRAAKLYLASCYRMGEGIEKSLEQAIELLTSLASTRVDESNPSDKNIVVLAEYHLWLCYKESKELGAEKNAKTWLIKSASNLYLDALYDMGSCYEAGEYGFEKSREKALSFYNDAADKGHPEAIKKLKRIDWRPEASENENLSGLFILERIIDVASKNPPPGKSLAPFAPPLPKPVSSQKSLNSFRESDVVKALCELSTPISSVGSPILSSPLSSSSSSSESSGLCLTPLPSLVPSTSGSSSASSNRSDGSVPTPSLVPSNVSLSSASSNRSDGSAPSPSLVPSNVSLSSASASGLSGSLSPSIPPVIAPISSSPLFTLFSMLTGTPSGITPPNVDLLSQLQEPYLSYMKYFKSTQNPNMIPQEIPQKASKRKKPQKSGTNPRRPRP